MKTILAVDDDDQILMMIEKALSDEYNIIAVNSGAMAFKYLYQQIPDLILLDILIPQMDGIAILNKVRNTTEWKKVPVIFISSKKKNIMCEELLQAGVADYIEKPFELTTMKERISNAMQRIKEKERENQVAFSPLNIDFVHEKEMEVQGIIDNTVVSISVNKIIYIDLRNNDYHLHTKHMEVVSKLPLAVLEQNLGKQFIRINPNLMINVQYVRYISEGRVTLDNGKVIMLSNRRKEELTEKIVEEMSKRIKSGLSNY